jgi:hypothetical protein
MHQCELVFAQLMRHLLLTTTRHSAERATGLIASRKSHKVVLEQFTTADFITVSSG